jgi:tRNA uridine 5-carboxymethylaminomethyl modification enzyme
VDDARWARFEAKREAMVLESQRLRSTWVQPATLAENDAMRVLGKMIEREYSLYDLLRRPEVSYATLLSLPGAGEALVDPEFSGQVEIEAKYAGYVARQLDEIERQRGLEDQALPADFDYMALTSLSIEVRQKLNQMRPATLGQASRISGVTPAAVSVLMVYLKRGELARKEPEA